MRAIFAPKVALECAKRDVAFAAAVMEGFSIIFEPFVTEVDGYNAVLVGDAAVLEVEADPMRELNIEVKLLCDDPLTDWRP